MFANIFNQKKILILLFLYVVINLSNYAQNTQNEIIGPTPSASEIGRFGTVPVGLFTGSMQYDVPIYELKNSNLSVPISLRYSSNGFVVDKVASTIGYDWSLDAGGVINCYGNGAKDAFAPRLTNSIDMHTATNLDIYNFCTTYNTPDQFSYCMPGHSGTFFLDNDGKPRSVVYNDLTISVNNYQFTITNSQGVKYVFADYSYYVDNNASWYLSSIIHPSGDTILFKYSASKTISDFCLNRSVYVNFNYPNNGPVPTWSEYISTRPVLYDKYLERIEFKGVGTVVFSNSFDRLDTSTDPKINKITILDPSGNLIKSFDLNYVFPHSNSQYDIKANTDGTDPGAKQNFRYRMFLDNIKARDNKNQEINSYKFQYNSLDTLPSRFCYSKDRWGYFNGKPNTDVFNLNDFTWLPSSEFEMLTHYVQMDKLSVCDLSPDASFSQHGMLSQITYPTGGYSKIFYEAHLNNSVGGCRVAKIATYPANNSLPDIKVYQYPSVIVAPQNFLYYQGSTFFYSEDVNGVCTTKSYDWIRLSPDLYMDNRIGNYHLCYNNVKILHGQNGENGTESHEFAAQLKIGPQVIWGQGMIYPIKWSNNDLFNGTPLRDTYTKNNMTIKKITYNYDLLSDKNSYKLGCYSINKTANGMKGAAPMGVGVGGCRDLFPDETSIYYNIIYYELYSRYPYLNSKREVLYTDNSDSIVTETNYTYCDAPYINTRSATTKTSQGKDLCTVYKYPFDNSSQSPYSNMVQNGNTSSIIEQQEYVNSNAQSLLKSVVSTDYNEIKTGLYLPVNIYKLDNPNLFDSGNYTTYANGLITRSSVFSLEKQIGYNSRGNIVNITHKDGIPITYLWGYNFQYPIAEIKNATYAQVTSALQGTTPDQLAAASIPDLSPVNALRQTLPNTLVSTFTYAPLIGTVTATDYRGVTTNYTYDTFSRLYLVRDNNKNIQGFYRYGYQNTPDNGQGGYTAPTTSITTGATSYYTGDTGTASLSSVTGGSGTYTYNWYLKDGSGNTLWSNLNTTASSVSYPCSQVGVFTVQCVITDNATGISGTVSTSITVTNLTYSCSFSLQLGFSSITSSISCTNSSTTYYLAFYTSSTMQMYTSYLVATICSSCRPSTTQTQTVTSGGRTWTISFYPNGTVYFTIISGTALSAGSGIGFGTLTFSK